MSDLTTRRIRDTYGDILQVSNGNSGVDGSLRAVSDGRGEASALSISTTAAKVTGPLNVTGDLTLGTPLPAASLLFNPPGTGGVPVTIQAREARTVDIRDYGGVADGVTDSRAALSNAITAAGVGGDVLFGPGVYRIDVTSGEFALPSAVRIRGAQSGTTIQFYRSAAGSASGFLVTGNNVSIEDMAITVSAVSGATVSMVFISGGARNTRLRRLRFNGGMVAAGASVNWTAHVLQVSSTLSALDYTIEDVTAESCAYLHLKANSATSDSSGFRLANARLVDIWNTVGPNSPSGTMDDILAIGNTIDTSARVVAGQSQEAGLLSSASGTGIRYVANHLKGVATRAIHIEEAVRRAVVALNTVGVNGATDGIRLLDNAISGLREQPQDWVLLGNVLVNIGAQQATGAAVRLTYDATAESAARKGIVMGNVGANFAYGLETEALPEEAILATGNLMRDTVRGIYVVHPTLGVSGNLLTENDVGIRAISGGLMGPQVLHANTLAFEAGTQSWGMPEWSVIADPLAHAGGSATTSVVLANNDAGFVGRLVVSAVGTAAADVSYRLYDVSYDGTTLTTVELARRGNGAVIITVRMDSGNLEARVFKSGAADTVRVQAHFSGLWLTKPAADAATTTVLAAGQMKPPASATPVNNGDLAIEATSNTTVTVKLKGSDGTVRSVALTLS